ncbi:MAG: globin, partial [Mesorhizobium sp.]
MSEGVPTLFEWAGGSEALNRLTQIFYNRVTLDPIVGPVFRHMSPDHP